MDNIDYKNKFQEGSKEYELLKLYTEHIIENLLYYDFEILDRNVVLNAASKNKNFNIRKMLDERKKNLTNRFLHSFILIQTLR